MQFVLLSNDMTNGQLIPRTFTCAGANVSPHLKWKHAPSNTKSFALICDDPDAPGGTYVHWVIFNIPKTMIELEQGIATTPQLGFGAKQGVNDGQKTGYTGPCPPAGPVHHYKFTLYALDAMLNLAEQCTKDELLAAMKGHVLGKAQLVGLYQKEQGTKCHGTCWD